MSVTKVNDVLRYSCASHLVFPFVVIQLDLFTLCDISICISLYKNVFTKQLLHSQFLIEYIILVA